MGLEIYRYRDNNDKVHYSQTKPTDSQVKGVITVLRNGGGGLDLAGVAKPAGHDKSTGKVNGGTPAPRVPQPADMAYGANFLYGLGLSGAQAETTIGRHRNLDKLLQSSKQQFVVADALKSVTMGWITGKDQDAPLRLSTISPEETRRNQYALHLVSAQANELVRSNPRLSPTEISTRIWEMSASHEGIFAQTPPAKAPPSW
jgi:hypothetical protein